MKVCILKYLTAQYWKDKKQQEEFDEKERLEIEKSVCEAEIEHYEAEMIAKKCGVNDMKNCSRECIHFRGGKVVLFNQVKGFNIPSRFSSILPGCKLWR